MVISSRSIPGVLAAIALVWSSWLTVPAEAAFLRVTDDAPDGRLRDAALSLSEALRLASGELTLGSLSGRERQQVLGEPGAGVADRIVFAPGTIVRLDREPHARQAVFPVLAGPGDSLDGRGATIDARGLLGRGLRGTGPGVEMEAGGRIAPLLLVTAPRARIAHLTIRGYPGPGILVQAGEAPRGVVVIRENRVSGAGPASIGVAVVGAPGGSVVRIEGNEIEGCRVGVLATASTGDHGGAPTGLRSLEIRGNRVSAAEIGIAVAAAVVRGGGQSAAGWMDRVWIHGNRIERARVESISVDAAAVFGGGKVAAARLGDVRVTRNRVVGADPPVGVGISVRGVLLSAARDAHARGASIESVRISGNELGSVAIGTRVLGAALSGCGSCGVRDVALGRVDVFGNRTNASSLGLVLGALESRRSTGSASGSRIGPTRIGRNHFVADGVGVRGFGARVVSDLGAKGAEPFAGGVGVRAADSIGLEISHAHVSSFDLRAGWIDAPRPIDIAGAHVEQEDVTVQHAHLRGLRVRDNEFRRFWPTVEVAGGRARAGTVFDAVVHGVEPERNRSPLGLAPTVDPVDRDVGESTATVEGSRVRLGAPSEPVDGRGGAG